MKLYKILVLLSILFLSGSFNTSHPIKLTSSLIEFNNKTNILKVECRVFIDDFTFSINDTFTKNFNAADLSKEDKEGIEEYFERYYKIIINDKLYPLEYASSQVFLKQNVLSLKFEKKVPVIKKGDQICVENTMFFEEFRFLQSNRITVRVPPFIKENYFEVTSLDEQPVPLNL